VPHGTQVPVRERRRFRLRGYHALWRHFPEPSTNDVFSYSRETRQSSRNRPYNPDPATTAVLTPNRFRLFPFRSPLLRESLVISFPPGTEMFHFPGFPPPGLTTRQSNTLTSVSGCPIRISPDQSPLAAPRGISLPAASFIGSCRLGIHRVLFLPYPSILRFSPKSWTSFKVHYLEVPTPTQVGRKQ
jgi:hypothetical protein